MRHSGCHTSTGLSWQMTIIEICVWRTCRHVLHALDVKSKHGMGQGGRLRDCTSGSAWCHNASQQVSHRYHIILNSDNNWDMHPKEVSIDPTCYGWQQQAWRWPRRPRQRLYKRNSIISYVVHHSKCHTGTGLSLQVTIIEICVWRMCWQVVHALGDKSKHGVGQEGRFRGCTSRIVWCHNVSQRVSHWYQIDSKSNNN